MQLPQGLAKAAVRAPLRTARDHAIKDVVAWVVAFLIVSGFVAAFGGALGWPQADDRVEGHVVDVDDRGDEAVISFEGVAGGRAVRWADRMDADHGWKVGETTTGWIVDGRFHRDVGFSLVGPAGSLLTLLSAMFAAWAVRRLLAIVIALADVRRSRYHPRRGYVALVENPNSKALRDVLVVWWDDPTAGTPGRRPDDHLLVEEGEAADMSYSKVWEAWIDAGRFWWTKPRWVVVRDGVFVPHRRVLFRPGRASLRWVESARPVPLEPATSAPAAREPSRPFTTILLWRLAGTAFFAVLSALVLDPGAPVRPQ